MYLSWTERIAALIFGMDGMIFLKNRETKNEYSWKKKWFSL